MTSGLNDPKINPKTSRRRCITPEDFPLAVAREDARLGVRWLVGYERSGVDLTSSRLKNTSRHCNSPD
jgi:hypothetical protein